jgi:hypothetical protein
MVVLSFGVIAAHFVAARRRTTGTQAGERAYERAIIFAFLILVGLVVNAGICGAISGPHARYQTRVVWLAVLAAGVLEATHPIILPRFQRMFARATDCEVADIPIYWSVLHKMRRLLGRLP